MGLALVGCQMPVCVLIAGLMANRCLLSCYVIYRKNNPLLWAASHSYYSVQPHLFCGEVTLLWLAKYFKSNSIMLLLRCQTSVRKTPNSCIRCQVGLFVSVIFICNSYSIQHNRQMASQSSLSELTWHEKSVDEHSKKKKKKQLWEISNTSQFDSSEGPW